MNRVTHKLILDIKSTISQQTLDVYLNDSARRLEIAFAEDNLAYKISSGCRAAFTAEKPDGTILYNDCAIIGNSVIFDFIQNPQIANVLGEVNCQVKLYGTDNDLITSPRFTLVVHKTVYREGGAVESSSEFTALTKLITEANKALEDIGDVENILYPNIFPNSFELWNDSGYIRDPVIGQALSPGIEEPNAVYRIRIVPGRSYNFTSTPLGSDSHVFFAVADKDGICLDFTTESIDKYDVRSDYDGTVPAYIYYGVADINNISDIEFRGETPTEVGTIKVEQTNEGAIVTAADKDGTTTAVIRNGKDGSKGSDGYTPVKGVDYFDGTNGKDGTSVTVASVSESTADGGSNIVTFSDGKKVTIKNGSKGSNGSNGTSVTVSNVSTSSADGGSNVVTFSDGKTLTVKNGSKGSKGATGADGYTPVKGIDYFTEAEINDIVQRVLESLKPAGRTLNITTTCWGTSSCTSISLYINGEKQYTTPTDDASLDDIVYTNTFENVTEAYIVYEGDGFSDPQTEINGNRIWTSMPAVGTQYDLLDLGTDTINIRTNFCN